MATAMTIPMSAIGIASGATRGSVAGVMERRSGRSMNRYVIDASSTDTTMAATFNARETSPCSVI